MRIYQSNSSNPGDIGVRIDSAEERVAFAGLFPGMGMSKYHEFPFGRYPVKTSLIYDAIFVESESDESKKLWMFNLGWDEYSKAIKGYITAEYQGYSPSEYTTGEWKVTVEFDANAMGADQLIKHEKFSHTQKRKGNPNARSSLVRALKTLLEKVNTRVKRQGNLREGVMKHLSTDKGMWEFDLAWELGVEAEEVELVLSKLRKEGLVALKSDGSEKGWVKTS